MQEYFNEKYLESHKYPRAKFKGKVVGFKNVSGKQTATAEGSLEIHGVTKKVSVEGELEISSGQIIIRSSFPVWVADYNIKIPRLVASNIAEVVDLKVVIRNVGESGASIHNCSWPANSLN